MTARVTLSCDGTVWPAGYPCGQAAPVGTPRDGAAARDVARRVHAWRTGQAADGDLVDLCPRCAKLAAEHPERGIRLLPPGRAALPASRPSGDQSTTGHATAAHELMRAF